MLDKSIKLLEITPDAVSASEAARYAGLSEPDSNFLECLASCATELESKLKPRAVMKTLDLSVSGSICKIGESEIHSRALSRALVGAEQVIIFAATLGLEADRMIAKYERLSPYRAHVLNSLANERIEAVCDKLSEIISSNILEDGYTAGKRFSAGYGDLPLSYQKEIFKILTPEKYIGLTLNESLLMSPVKSVSAIIGVKKETKDDIS